MEFINIDNTVPPWEVPRGTETCLDECMELYKSSHRAHLVLQQKGTKRADVGKFGFRIKGRNLMQRLGFL